MITSLAGQAVVRLTQAVGRRDADVLEFRCEPHDDVSPFGPENKPAQAGTSGFVDPVDPIPAMFKTIGALTTAVPASPRSSTNWSSQRPRRSRSVSAARV